MGALESDFFCDPDRVDYVVSQRKSTTRNLVLLVTHTYVSFFIYNITGITVNGYKGFNKIVIYKKYVDIYI